MVLISCGCSGSTFRWFAACRNTQCYKHLQIAASRPQLALNCLSPAFQRKVTFTEGPAGDVHLVHKSCEGHNLAEAFLGTAFRVQGWFRLDLDRVGRRGDAREVLDARRDVSDSPGRQEVLLDLELLLPKAAHGPRQQQVFPRQPALRHLSRPSLHPDKTVIICNDE